jgi:hypothetical protein
VLDEMPHGVLEGVGLELRLKVDGTKCGLLSMCL